MQALLFESNGLHYAIVDDAAPLSGEFVWEIRRIHTISRKLPTELERGKSSRTLGGISEFKRASSLVSMDLANVAIYSIRKMEGCDELWSIDGGRKVLRVRPLERGTAICHELYRSFN